MRVLGILPSHLVLLIGVAAPFFSGACGPGVRAGAALRPVEEYTQAGDTWTDHSPHRAGFVTANGARLHYLDWGGRGETVVLLAGLTMNPHVFDDLAPALAKDFRVVGITRRGHGESERSAGGYQLDTLAADVAAVLDSLGIARAHLVGHSIAGAEITAFALRYPERLGKLVYLDASVAAVTLPPRPAMDDPLPEPPRPPGWEASLLLLRRWVSSLTRDRWSDAMEATLRVRHQASDGRWRDPLAPGVAAAILEARRTFNPDLKAVRAAALGLYSRDEEHPRMNLAHDDSTRAAAAAYVDVRLRPQLRAVWAQFETLPRNRLVLVSGGIDHYFFVTNPVLVLREIRDFLAAP